MLDDVEYDEDRMDIEIVSKNDGLDVGDTDTDCIPPPEVDEGIIMVNVNPFSVERDQDDNSFPNSGML